MPKLKSPHAWYSSFNPWAGTSSEEENSSPSSTDLDTTAADSSGEEEASSEPQPSEAPIAREEPPQHAPQPQLGPGTRPTLIPVLSLPLQSRPSSHQPLYLILPGGRRQSPRRQPRSPRPRRQISPFTMTLRSAAMGNHLQEFLTLPRRSRRAQASRAAEPARLLTAVTAAASGNSTPS